MHLNQDMSKALQMLEHIKSDISRLGDARLERDTLCDLHLLISALDNPVVRGQAVLQDSMDELRQQLLKDPQLGVDGFDITFAGRLLLDDGHYSEPVYESPEDDDKREEIGRETTRNRAESKQKHDRRTLAGIQTTLSTPMPLLSIPIPTTPVLMPGANSPAILLQIPLLTTEKAATAGLTINDLYLGRLTPEVGDDGMAMFRPSSGDSDRSPNGSQTSLNSGWSKSSSIVQLHCDEADGRRNGTDGGLPKINQGTAQCDSITKQPQSVETTPIIDERSHQPSSPVVPPANPAYCRPSRHAHQLHDHAHQPHDHTQRPHLSNPVDQSDGDDDDEDDIIGSVEVVTTVELTKGTRGLGFSVCERRRGRGLCVVGSLVEGGVAQVDGRLRPGDRLCSVNGRALAGGGLDEAVQALRGAPCGPVTIGVRRRVSRQDDGHYEEIEGGRETAGERRNGKTEQNHREQMEGVMTHAEKVQVQGDEGGSKEQTQEQYEARAELHFKPVPIQQQEEIREHDECD